MEYLNEDDFSEFMNMIQEGHVLKHGAQHQGEKSAKLSKVSPDAKSFFEKMAPKTNDNEIFDEKFLDEKELEKLEAAVAVYEKQLTSEGAAQQKGTDHVL